MTQHEDRPLAATEQQLLREVGPALGEDRVRSDVRDVLRSFEVDPVRTDLSVLALRQARQRLRSLSAA